MWRCKFGLRGGGRSLQATAGGGGEQDPQVGEPGAAEGEGLPIHIPGSGAAGADGSPRGSMAPHWRGGEKKTEGKGDRDGDMEILLLLVIKCSAIKSNKTTCNPGDDITAGGHTCSRSRSLRGRFVWHSTHLNSQEMKSVTL